MDKVHVTPCVTCRWAEWYPHDKRFGQCGHPMAAAERNAPYVLRRARPDSIQRTISLSAFDCNGHEPSGPPPEGGPPV